MRKNKKLGKQQLEGRRQQAVIYKSKKNIKTGRRILGKRINVDLFSKEYILS